MKVHFLVAGVQKCGTTTLHRLLAQHPDVHMASVKGTHFFDTESHFGSGPVDYSVYHACFSPEPQHRVLGEATPIYSFWEPAMRRIRDYNPAMKVLLLLRNPIDRAYSHWNMMRTKKLESAGFEEAIALEPQRARCSRPLQDRHFSYVARGFYTEQLRRLAEHFPPEQRLVLRMEDMLDPASGAMDRIWDFLGVDRPVASTPVHANRRAYAAPMAPETRRMLAATFESEIRDLERMLGWDLSHWLADPPAPAGFSEPRR